MTGWQQHADAHLSCHLSRCPCCSEGPHHICTIHPEICDLQSCLQPRAHESLCQGSGAPLCESRVTEIQPSVGSPGFMACTSHCPTGSCWSFISCGVFSAGTIKEMAGLMEKPQPHGIRQHARQPSEGFNSTRHFLLLFFLGGMLSLPYPKGTCTQWSFTT